MYRYLVRIGAGPPTSAIASCSLAFALFSPAAVIEALSFRVFPLGWWLLLALPSAAFGLLGPPLCAVLRGRAVASRVLASIGGALVLAGLFVIFAVPDA